MDDQRERQIHDHGEFKEILHALAGISRKLDSLMATEAEVQAALAKIDAATTKIGANVQTSADTIQTISDEMDALVLALKNDDVSPELAAQASALADRAQAVSDSLDRLPPILTAIAAKGAKDPVPVPVPNA
jgi:methyl-accepting chemotaxis protein